MDLTDYLESLEGKFIKLLNEYLEKPFVLHKYTCNKSLPIKKNVIEDVSAFNKATYFAELYRIYGNILQTRQNFIKNHPYIRLFGMTSDQIIKLLNEKKLKIKIDYDKYERPVFTLVNVYMTKLYTGLPHTIRINNSVWASYFYKQTKLAVNKFVFSKKTVWIHMPIRIIEDVLIRYISKFVKLIPPDFIHKSVIIYKQDTKTIIEIV